MRKLLAWKRPLFYLILPILVFLALVGFPPPFPPTQPLKPTQEQSEPAEKKRKRWRR
jgi:hypothetical protein